MNKARIVLLADRAGWAFDFVARSLRWRLEDEFDVRVEYSLHRPDLDPAGFDLLHVFFWADEWHRRFGIPQEKLVIEVASHRWRDAPYELSPAALVDRYLSGCDTVTTPSADLRDVLRPHHPRVFLTPNGFEPSLFHPGARPAGHLKIAWAGQPEDPCKGLHDILRPACENRFELAWTDGTWSRSRVARLYRSADVLAVASTAESQPLPLIEAMACGCFPVATPVGIVPRLVVDGSNGLLVERRVDAFRNAFAWCEENREHLRAQRSYNAQLMLSNRSWDQCSQYCRQLYRHALHRRRAGEEVRPPADLLRVEETPELPEGSVVDDPVAGAPGLRERMSRTVASLGWRLSDLRAQLARLRHVVRRDGWTAALGRRFLSAGWYRRLVSTFRSGI